MCNIEKRCVLSLMGKVRMAQGPDGVGFRPGHRPTPSLYAPDGGSCASETTAARAKAKDDTVTEATVMAST